VVTRISSTIVLIAILLAAFALTGCTTEEALTAEQIVAKAVAAVDDVESYRAEMDMKVTTSGEADGESVNWTMSMDGSAAIDQANEKMSITMHTDVEGEGLDEFATPSLASTDITMYMMDDAMYMKADLPIIGERWIKQELPEDAWEGDNPMTLWANQLTLEQQLELLESANAELLGEETVDTVDCYKLRMSPDLANLLSIMGQSGLPDIPEEELDIESLFEEISIVQWFAKDTFLLRKSQVRMVMSISPETLGSSGTEGEVSIEMHMNVWAHDYNESLDIQLPEGAKNAMSVPSFP